MLTYFVPLGFIPDFDFSDITGLLVIAALFGITQLIWLGAILLMPTMLGISSTFALSKSGRYRRLSILAALASQFLWILMLWHNVASDQIWVGGALLTFLVLAGACSIFKALSSLAKILLDFSVQGVICAFAVVIFRPSADSFMFELEDWMQWSALGAWCFLVSIANVALTKDEGPTLQMSLGVGAYLIFTLVLMTNNLGYVHGFAVRALGLGGIENAIVTISDAGSTVVKGACNIQSAPAACEADVFRVGEVTGHSYSNITILSRMGRQQYLQLCRPTDKSGPCATKDGLRVVLDKKDVLGWTTAGRPGTIIP